MSPGAVCVCSVSPLGHTLSPVFLQVRSPGWFHLRAQPLVRVADGRKRSTGEIQAGSVFSRR
jgi:hypothetical protein